MHRKPRPQPQGVRERLSQYKFDAIDIKTLNEIRQTGADMATNKKYFTAQDHATSNTQLQVGAECQKSPSTSGGNGFVVGDSRGMDKRIQVREILSMASLQLQRPKVVQASNSSTNPASTPPPIFSSEHAQSTDSIFSPKFDIVSSDKKKANPMSAYKFSFTDNICEVPKQKDLTKTKEPTVEKESILPPVSNQVTSVVSKLKSKPIKLKRATSSQLKSIQVNQTWF